MSERPVGPIPVDGEDPEEFAARYDAFARGRWVEDHPEQFQETGTINVANYVAREMARAAPIGTRDQIVAVSPAGRLYALAQEAVDLLAEVGHVEMATELANRLKELKP